MKSSFGTIWSCCPGDQCKAAAYERSRLSVKDGRRILMHTGRQGVSAHGLVGMFGS
jgi:hypothetical protein